ncbi:MULTISPECIES: 4,5-dihydroxyphthalate decarboxylase [unclassified Streptomyces]|uniref:ABC transporter substrate-binding protein n=1 Tax=unclassified Streptomyces TaxID=2593676 RepID=UPI00081E561E|nr:MULTISPECIES: 4,5-dihydroxyphthalate decarboxylase [unclassified Streptomyces]MYR25988.1 ABC transporter substrate-binding protein [Streptomyces sp. SID4945]SCD42117.1 4,5-dihydroxyphthalate decarboxylase [Streptomyces sp. TverLS-915]SCE92953.1 4,5-dihydroxyphthalate decarboxylase [Streptomyces sp. LcepLS]
MAVPLPNSPSSVPRLRTVTRTQGATEALKNGEVSPHGLALDFEEVPVLVHAFRRMVRELAYDVSEMAVTTYLVAKAHGVRFTALPAFLVRDFHHGAVLVDPESGIREPKDLEGKAVGVNRGYTVTTGVWARAVLAEEYGVDLDKITWVLSGDEHVAAFRPPHHVEPMRGTRGLGERLLDGELAATIGAPPAAPRVRALIPEPREAGLRALRERGHWPVNHLVVVRDDVLRAHPDAGAEIFHAFARAKRAYVERLRGPLPEPTAQDRTLREVMAVTGADPLPYGLAPNREVLDSLLRHAVDQHILERPPAPESLFDPGTLDLVG